MIPEGVNNQIEDSKADWENLPPMLNSKQGDAVSDTTEADSSNADHQIKISFTQWLKDNGYKLWHARAAIDGINTEYIKDGDSYKLDDLISEWFKPYLKIPSIDWEGLENSAQLAKVRIKNLFNDGNDSDRIDFAFDQLFEKLHNYIK